MYDTIKLNLITSEAAKVPNLLTELKTTTGDGYYCQHGKLRNMDVRVYPSSLYVEGSLPEYINGHNFEGCTIKQARLAIEQLSDSLKLPMDKAKVNRIDVAENFVLTRPVREYRSLLGDSRYFYKYSESDGLYYFNSRKKKAASRVKVFYDKTKEYQDKKKANSIPEIFKERQVLRYELRFTKRLKQQFGTEIKAVDLYNENFFTHVVNRWLNSYNGIKKMKAFKNMDFNMKDIKDLREFALALSFMDELRLKVIMNRLERAKETGEMNDRTYYRCKSEVNRLLENGKFFEPDDCLLELDHKVQEAANCYLYGDKFMSVLETGYNGNAKFRNTI